MAELIQKQDTLNQGREKINAAITDAEVAKSTSEQAYSKSTQALANSESTQTQLDTIVIEGDSSIEAAQARVDEKGVSHATLKARIDDGFVGVTAKMADNAYYENYSVTKLYDEISETEYLITKISHKDTKGNIIPLQLSKSSKSEGETVREFANRHNSTLAFNASTQRGGIGNNPTGIFIVNGEVIQDIDPSPFYTLGIKSDNELKVYDSTYTAQMILEDGSLHALVAFIPLIENSASVSEGVLGIYEPFKEPHPRQVIGQLPNKDLIFLTSGGRGQGGKGMDVYDLIRILSSYEVETAYMLDGGGSVTTVEKGSIVSSLVDENGTKERKRPSFLHFSKPMTKRLETDVRDINKKIGDIILEIGGFKNLKIIDDVDRLNESGFYWGLRNASGAPNSENSWFIIHFNVLGEKMQIAFPFSSSATNLIFIRRTTESIWGEWAKDIDAPQIERVSQNKTVAEFEIGNHTGYVQGWSVGSQTVSGTITTIKPVNVASYCRQIIYQTSSGNIYTRYGISDTEWSNFYSINREIVS